MLTDENELNDETIERINGGLEEGGLIPPGSVDNPFNDLSKAIGIPQSNLCPNCELGPLKTNRRAAPCG